MDSTSPPWRSRLIPTGGGAVHLALISASSLQHSLLCWSRNFCNRRFSGAFGAEWTNRARDRPPAVPPLSASVTWSGPLSGRERIALMATGVGLSVVEVTVQFGGLTALDGVSLAAEQGEGGGG